MSKFISNSQCGQDYFVYKLLIENQPQEQYSGTFIDIGCSLPIFYNNSYSLEKYYNWNGILIDIDSSLRNSIEKERTSKFIDIDVNDNNKWVTLVKESGFKWNKVIDYLSFDVDDSGLEVIEKFPFNEFEFKVITLEHDKYRFGQSTQDRMQEILKNYGYEVICNNVKNDDSNHSNVYFEDWWVNPKYVDMNIANKYRCDSKQWSDIL
jgi:hypothetical protein